MTEENAIEVIEERVKQLEKDPAVRAILLDRFNRGDSIDDLKTYLTNMAIYTLYVPIEP
ncbi:MULTISPECIES: hypothetical protein [Bacteroidales]|jgi:hypothetical protein|uniref:hypothetical protein n=1 Tax=Bacteroidales TaxID=171549 RepID=UPI0026737ABF|nr:hypothetical protein [Alistipes ihumii]